MSEKLLYEIEMAFLKQIYEHKGAIGVNELLGEAMKGVPFKSERELKMGLSNIEKFLMAQAIESSVRDDVFDVIVDIS